NVAKVREINDFATGGLVPDRSYFIDLSAQAGRQRLKKRRRENQMELDRIEQKQLAYHEQVREAFHMLFENNKKRIYLLNGEEDNTRLFTQVKDDFKNLWLQYQNEGGG